MFGIDWNLDGEVDMVDDFLNLALFEESQENEEDVEEDTDKGE